MDFVRVTEQYYTVYFVLAITFVIIFWADRKIRKMDPLNVSGVAQNLIEIVSEFFSDIVRSMLGEEHVRGFTPMVIVMFVSIFLTNMSSLFLLKEGAYTNPVYTFTWSMSMAVFWSFYAIKKTGVFKFFKNAFVGEFAPMAPIETIGFLIKPVSLGIRLMGNITAGAFIMGIIYMIPQLVLNLVGTNIITVPVFGVIGAGIGALFASYFSIFGPFIQAIVFTYLTLANIAGLLPQEEE